MKDKISKAKEDQRVRYLVTGLTSYVFEYSLFVTLMAATSMLFLANSLSFLGGFFLSFYLHKKWSFNSGEHKHKTHTQFGGYALLAAINLVLTNVLIGVMVDGWNIKPFIAKFLVMFCIVLWNYVIMSKLLFKKQEEL